MNQNKLHKSKNKAQDRQPKPKTGNPIRLPGLTIDRSFGQFSPRVLKIFQSGKTFEFEKKKGK